MIMAQLVTGCKVWASLSLPLPCWRWSRLGSTSCDHQTVTNKTQKQPSETLKSTNGLFREGSPWIYEMAPWYMVGLFRRAMLLGADLRLQHFSLYMLSSAIHHSNVAFIIGGTNTVAHFTVQTCTSVCERATRTDLGDVRDRTGNPIWVGEAGVMLDDVRPIHSAELYSSYLCGSWGRGATLRATLLWCIWIPKHLQLRLTWWS